MNLDDLNWFGDAKKNHSILAPEEYETLAIELRATGASDEQVAEIISDFEDASIRMNLLHLMHLGLAEIADIDDGEPRFAVTQKGLDYVKNLDENEL